MEELKQNRSPSVFDVNKLINLLNWHSETNLREDVILNIGENLSFETKLILTILGRESLKHIYFDIYSNINPQSPISNQTKLYIANQIKRANANRK